MRQKERANQLKSDIPALWLALKDPDTPPIARVLAGITVAYALSPMDLIPDFIPVLGALDDLLLLPALAAAAIHFIPKDVWQRSQSRAENLWAGGKPKKWYFCIPILLFWLLLIWLIARAFFF